MNTTDAQTLYQKVGNKYVPVAEHVQYEFLRYGTYMVQVRPGTRSLWSLVHVPKLPWIEASLKVMAEGIHKAMAKKMVSPKVPQKLTKSQLAAFDAWRKAFKTDTVALPSRQEIVDAGLQELREYLEQAGS